jgi:hypothetical protein
LKCRPSRRFFRQTQNPSLDGVVTAEVQSETARLFEGPQADQKQMRFDETAGIPTGIAPDIHKQVELRKAR